jgi:hypothetical protein
VNCCVCPAATDAFAGVTAIETTAGAATIRFVEPVTDPKAAWTLVTPCPTLVAKPAALMVATPEALEDHVTDEVRFCVVLSLYIPVAVNCCFNPSATEELAGVTAMDDNAYPRPLKVSA